MLPLFSQSINKNNISIGLLDDIIGLSNFRPRFVKQYSNIKKIIEKSVKRYCDDVKNKKFPSIKHVYKL